jgi:hypothetical protein
LKAVQEEYSLLPFKAVQFGENPKFWRDVFFMFSLAKYEHNQAANGDLLFGYCFLLGLILDIEDGGDTSLRNVGELLQNYAGLQPRRSYIS